jgi:serine/threonine protein kinase
MTQSDTEVIVFESPQKAEWVKNALDILKQLQFPYLVKYYSVKVSNTTVEIEREYFINGSLSEYIYELSVTKNFMSEKVFYLVLFIFL